jgi:hypothetical protein
VELCLSLKAVALSQTVVVGFTSPRPGFEPSYVRFVVDKVALGLAYPEYFGFRCQFSFHRLLHIHHHLSSRAGTIGQLVADVPSGHSLTPPHEAEKYTPPSTKVFMSWCSINCIGVKFYVYYKMWLSSRMWRRVAWKIGTFWRNLPTTLYRVPSVKTILLICINVRVLLVLNYQAFENKC